MVVDRAEIVRVEFGKKRIRDAQSRIMDPQVPLQDLATMMNFLETPHCCRSASVVTPKIDQRLFALENRSDTWLFSIWSVRGHVGAISTPRQCDFHCARGITLSLRPYQSKPFQARVRQCFAVTGRQALIHSASSRPQ